MSWQTRISTVFFVFISNTGGRFLTESCGTSHTLPEERKEEHPRSVAAFVRTWVKSGLAMLAPSPTTPVLLRIRRQ